MRSDIPHLGAPSTRQRSLVPVLCAIIAFAAPPARAQAPGFIYGPGTWDITNIQMSFYEDGGIFPSLNQSYWLFHLYAACNQSGCSRWVVQNKQPASGGPGPITLAAGSQLFFRLVLDNTLAGATWTTNTTDPTGVRIDDGSGSVKLDVDLQAGTTPESYRVVGRFFAEDYVTSALTSGSVSFDLMSQPTAVPEPRTLSLLATGMFSVAGISFARKRRQRANVEATTQLL